MPRNVFNVKNVEVLNLLAALVSISRFEIVGINEITGKGAAERFHSLKLKLLLICHLFMWFTLLLLLVVVCANVCFVWIIKTNKVVDLIVVI